MPRMTTIDFFIMILFRILGKDTKKDRSFESVLSCFPGSLEDFRHGYKHIDRNPLISARLPILHLAHPLENLFFISTEHLGSLALKPWSKQFPVLVDNKLHSVTIRILFTLFRMESAKVFRKESFWERYSVAQWRGVNIEKF